MVTRLVEQKGVSLLLNIFDMLMAEGVSLILLGNGEPYYREKFVSFEKKYKGQFYFDFSFNKPLGHKIFAGADIFLMPSRYEPCGITQMQSMKYGTLPLAHKTGGLVDTIKHNITGFIFNEYHAGAFYNMILHANNLYQIEEKWQQMIKNAMKEDFSWDKSVEKYIESYEDLTGRSDC
jgi:starch synthase